MRIFALMVFGFFLVACDTPPQVDVLPDAGEEPVCDRWDRDICDAIDNDCDGVVDEAEYATEGWGEDCDTGLPGNCGEGRWNQCNEGALVCTSFYEPGEWSEFCNGEDDDCDGFVDEGDPEECDARDNDCDGLIDEDFPGLDEPCFVGVGACVRDGVVVCNREKTAATCNALPDDPSPEACDAEDNDCDGIVDEGVPYVGDRCDFLQEGLLCAGEIVCLPVDEDGQQHQACAHLDPPVCQ